MRSAARFRSSPEAGVSIALFGNQSDRWLELDGDCCIVRIVASYDASLSSSAATYLRLTGRRRTSSSRNVHSLPLFTQLSQGCSLVHFNCTQPKSTFPFWGDALASLTLRSWQRRHLCMAGLVDHHGHTGTLVGLRDPLLLGIHGFCKGAREDSAIAKMA